MFGRLIRYCLLGMRVAVTGGSGLLGRAVIAAVARTGGEAIACGRTEDDGPTSRRWEASSGFATPSALDDVDAVVHLAGENIGRRWTADQKAAIRSSRIAGTQSIALALAHAAPRRRVLVSASAVGYYGDCGDVLVDEERGPGSGFLAQVCQGWEAMANSAAAAQTRVVVLRFAMILARGGGTLARLAPLFRTGLGGRLGHGRQWMPWIHLDDAVAVVLRVIADHSLRGAFNTCAPNPVRNSEFSAKLGRALGRPALVPAPRFALRMALGEMADELLLAGQRAVPRRLEAAGHRFAYPELSQALAAVFADDDATGSPS